MAFSTDKFKCKIMSFPIRINCQGWETNTLSLQRYGWQLSADQDLYSRSIRILFKHPEDNIYGMTNLVTFNYFMDEMEARDITLSARMASDFIIQDKQGITFDNVMAINAEPSYYNISRTILSDAKWFKTVVDDNSESLSEDEIEEKTGVKLGVIRRLKI